MTVSVKINLIVIANIGVFRNEKIIIFDPAMCCSTGVCGPSIDKKLLRVATLLNSIKSHGVVVERHNLTGNPQIFVDNKTVNRMLLKEGVEVLPIIMIDGEVVKTKAYPASNLQDVFNTDLNNKGVAIKEVLNLVVANFDPEQAAAEYRESVVGPFRGKLPKVVIKNMEEQLSGSCTVEIAAFNEFSSFITDEKAALEYDHIIFDTAPTGHTLRMLQLHSAWSSFISESIHGASCLGQLAGLEDKKEIYKNAVNTLADAEKTTLILVARPEPAPLKEAERASKELQDIGLNNQVLVVNGVLDVHDDKLSDAIFFKQQKAFKNIPEGIKSIETFNIPLRPYNITGLENVRAFLKEDNIKLNNEKINTDDIPRLKNVIDDLYNSGKKVIFTMGKGGVLARQPLQLQ